MVIRSLILLALAGSLFGASVTVSNGGDLQAALNQAQGGDVITLQAGAVFTGHYTVPANNSGKVITIQSSAMNSLPSGVRVSNTQTALMAKLQTPDAQPVLLVPGGSNDYTFQGLEFATSTTVYVNDLIRFGTAGETTIAALPHDLLLDRCYVHGALPPVGGKRGLALNSGKATIQNSYFENFTSDWQDTQAIEGWNGSGPFLIQNNFLQAGGEIVAFGGAPAAIPGLIPSDITIQNNDFFKPTYWWDNDPHHIGPHIRAKNHLEFKNAQRALIQYNTFTNNMVGADQNGFTMLLNVRVEGGAVPWATVSNITVQYNVFRHIAGGFFLAGRDGGGGTGGNIKIENNLLFDMGVMGGMGSGFEVISDVNNLTINHNTVLQTGWIVVFAGDPSSGFTMTNNIISAGASLAGDNGNRNDKAAANAGRGQGTMNYFAPGGRVANNVIIAPNVSDFTGPSFVKNQFVSDVNSVGFVNPTAGNYSLPAGSRYVEMGASGGFVSQGFGAAPAVGSTAPRPPLAAPPPPPAPAPPANASIGTGWMTIRSVNSGLCLDVPASAATKQGKQPGIQLQQWTCNNSPQQQFQFKPVAGGYEIVSQISGLGLDMWGGPAAVENGVALAQQTYGGGTNEIFIVEDLHNGSYAIHPRNSLKCLDVSNWGTQPGALIQQWICVGTANQAWKIVPAPQ